MPPCSHERNAKKLLDQFDSLPHAEQQEVLLQLMRRVAFEDHEFPTAAELVEVADRVFTELDRRETKA